jgi:hypothetical protein
MGPDKLGRVHVSDHGRRKRLWPVAAQDVQQALRQQAPQEALLRQGAQARNRQPPLLSFVRHLFEQRYDQGLARPLSDGGLFYSTLNDSCKSAMSKGFHGR